MKKILFLSVLLGFLTLAMNGVSAQIPDYAKYGKIATAVVKEDYPNQKVVEYQYMGREKKSETEVTDTFRFEIEEDSKKVFVNVLITHDLKNNKTLSIVVKEVQ